MRGGGRCYRPHPDASRSCWSGLRASAPRPRLTKLVCDCVARTASAARYKHASQRQVNVMRASCVKQLQRVVRELCRASRRSQAAGHGFTTDRGAGPATNTPLVPTSRHGSRLSNAAGSRTMATRRNRLGTLVACDATGQVVTHREHGSAISVSAGLRTAYGDLTWSPGHWRPARHLDRRGGELNHWSGSQPRCRITPTDSWPRGAILVGKRWQRELLCVPGTGTVGQEFDLEQPWPALAGDE